MTMCFTQTAHTVAKLFFLFCRKGWRFKFIVYYTVDKESKLVMIARIFYAGRDIEHIVQLQYLLQKLSRKEMQTRPLSHTSDVTMGGFFHRSGLFS